jgi:hypothetical protein
MANKEVTSTCNAGPLHKSFDISKCPACDVLQPPPSVSFGPPAPDAHVPLDRFTDAARKVLVLADEEAKRLSHNAVESGHLLMGICSLPCVASTILNNLDVDLPKLRREAAISFLLGGSKAMVGRLPLTPGANEALRIAIEEAKKMGNSYVGTEHILLGLLSECSVSARMALTAVGLKLEQVREAALERYATRRSKDVAAGKADIAGFTPVTDALVRDHERLVQYIGLLPIGLATPTCRTDPMGYLIASHSELLKKPKTTHHHYFRRPGQSDTNVVSVEEVNALQARRREINNMDISKVTITENGEPVNVLQKYRDEWKFTGMGLLDFIEMGGYREGMTRLGTLKVPAAWGSLLTCHIPTMQFIGHPGSGVIPEDWLAHRDDCRKVATQVSEDTNFTLYLESGEDSYWARAELEVNGQILWNSGTLDAIPEMFKFMDSKGENYEIKVEFI